VEEGVGGRRRGEEGGGGRREEETGGDRGGEETEEENGEGQDSNRATLHSTAQHCTAHRSESTYSPSAPLRCHVHLRYVDISCVQHPVQTLCLFQ
jgi:hypothetical protein